MKTLIPTIAVALATPTFLLDTAAKEEGWGRIKATGYCLQLAEALAAAGKKKDAAKLYQNLKKNRNTKNESHVRLACDKGLAALK
jgi:hypothetical protein